VELEDYDGDDIIDHAVSRMDRYNLFIGRVEIHLARSEPDLAQARLMKVQVESSS
jgi:hypothetical protein